ncbi:MAG: AAA family ATPase, partial [Chloroflexales bacterium]|nr:AAA family ATPase [Chloroflexales bacterium]
MTTRDNVHLITDADLDARRGDAEFRMQNVPMRGVSYDVLAELRKLPGVGGYLLSEPVNHLLHTLRRGLCLYYVLYDAVTKRVGAQPAFAGSYALFGASALIAHELPEPAGESVAALSDLDEAYFKVDGAPDDNLKAALSYFLKLVVQLADDGTLESPADLVNITRTFFAAAQAAMTASADRHTAGLLAQVEGAPVRVGALELRGFAASASKAGSKVTFAPVLPDQVVGNTSAKRALTRYVDRLALYDAARGLNPVLELGGLPSTVLFDGFPGTGKTSLFRMAMTRLTERAQQVGLPIHLITIDPGIKDEYYGRTAKNLQERLALMRDTKALALAFFDDIDLLLLSRGDPGMGGADKDVLNITMQFLDGALTTHIGNAQTYAATNEPTATDSALRQRFHHREQIGGPEDWDDYASLIGIKLARQIKSGLVRVGGELPTTSAAAQTQSAERKAQSEPAGTAVGGGAIAALRSTFSALRPSAMSWRELGELCAEFKRKDPRFTGRPIESVTQKLLAESANFDVPEEWFTDPAIYTQRSYDERVQLLTTLYVPITGEMIAQELEHYFRSEQRYADDARAQRAERMAG